MFQLKGFVNLDNYILNDLNLIGTINLNQFDFRIKQEDYLETGLWMWTMTSQDQTELW